MSNRTKLPPLVPLDQLKNMDNAASLEYLTSRIEMVEGLGLGSGSEPITQENIKSVEENIKSVEEEVESLSDNTNLGKLAKNKVTQLKDLLKISKDRITELPESTKKDYLLTVFEYNDDKNSLKDDVVVAANVSKDIMSLALNGEDNLELKKISQAAEDLNKNYVENLIVNDGTMKGGKRSKRKSSKRKSSKRKSSKRGRKGKRSTKHRR